MRCPGCSSCRLPNDHTSGTSPGAPTPTAYLADNDLALGRVVEAVSHGKFWKDTAIFVLEDDAQDGPDHVDAHRSPALVVSPYTKRRHVDSHMYSTSSMLRTMELILGLKPMTQFDAAAEPMYDSFQAAADTTPFRRLPPGVSLDERNVAGAWGAKSRRGLTSAMPTWPTTSSSTRSSGDPSGAPTIPCRRRSARHSSAARRRR